MNSSDPVLLEKTSNGIAVCRFNRPAMRNALNEDMVRGVRRVLQELWELPGVACLIFTGSEKAFVSGADIMELKERGRADALRRINTDLFREIEQFPMPTIAAIRGFALGGGCELAMACDLRIAGRGAKFGQPEVGLGIIPGAGATYRLPRLVGIGRAKELIYTGRIIDASEAERIGLVNQVVNDEEVLDHALTLATEIGKNSLLAVRCAKAALSAAAEMGTDVGMVLEATTQALLFEDAEKHRRMGAFLEKREAKRQMPKGET